MYPSNKKKKVWREEKERLLKMSLEERRKEYIRDYVPLNTILSWKEEVKGKSQNDAWLLQCLKRKKNPQKEKLQMKEDRSMNSGQVTTFLVENSKALCLICKEFVQDFKHYNLKRPYMQKPAAKCNVNEGLCRQDKIVELKKSLS
ncbi:uncharacterized protein AAES06_000458 isoform 1-T1 [Glossophaga mutica]